jgi:hypothetical protein
LESHPAVAVGVDIQIVLGPRKRLRANDGATEESTASPSRMGAIERKINCLSVDQVAFYAKKLLDTIMDAVDPSDQSPLHDPFLQLPDARVYPDYYHAIKRPIALDQIHNKLNAKAYQSLPEIKHDCETICNNAKRYNQRDSEIWLKARELHVSILPFHIPW